MTAESPMTATKRFMWERFLRRARRIGPWPVSTNERGKLILFVIRVGSR